MPFRSKAQAAYFNTHRKQLESQGVDVDEWNAASKGKSLPARIGKTRKQKTLAKLSRAMKGYKR